MNPERFEYSKFVNSTSPSSAWTYIWDPAGDMLRVTNNGITQGSYAYDANGRKVESIETSTTTFFAYLGTDTLYEPSTGHTSVHYVYAAGFMIANVTGTTVSYYHTDALGSTRLMTNTSGGVIFSDNYQPFGQDNGTPSTSETYKFTGKPVSQTTGLYYYGARWYDPTIGRFISADPLAGHKVNPQSLNSYLYVLDNPSSNTDPTGLDCFSSLSSFGGCVGNFIYDNTAGAAINSYNWWQGASNSDRWAFVAGIFTAVAIGALVGASCVVAACAGLVLVGMGVLAGVGGSFGAADAYHFAGGQSEGGLKASMLWGGIGGGLGFAGGSALTTSLWNRALQPTELPYEINLGSDAPRFRIGTSEVGWYSDSSFNSVGALEDEFGHLSRSFTQNVYRYSVQFAPDTRGFVGPQGSSGAMQFLLRTGTIYPLSEPSLYSIAPMYVAPIVSATGMLAASVPS